MTTEEYNLIMEGVDSRIDKLVKKLAKAESKITNLEKDMTYLESVVEKYEI